MTYNVELFEFDDPATVRAVGEGDADIIALQETTPQWETVLRDVYEERYPHMLFHGTGSSALAVISRYPLEDRGVHEGPNGWHPSWHVGVETPLGFVELLNVHLRSYFTGRSTAVEAYLKVDSDHLHEIDLFSSACDGTLRNIVLGDFNEDEDGPALGYLENEGFRNALLLYHPGQGTWRHASLGGQLTKTLDHILFDETFEPLDAWVERRGDSDHLPVIAHLERAQNE